MAGKVCCAIIHPATLWMMDRSTLSKVACPFQMGASTERRLLDQVCKISNGASESVGATYWKIPSLSCGQGTCFTKIAFFDDGKGKLISGTNNCVQNSTPITVAFTRITTGSSTVALSEAPFACAPENNTPSGTVIHLSPASLAVSQLGYLSQNSMHNHP